MRYPVSPRILSLFVSRSLVGRDYVVDVFRGLAVIGMILVNHPIPLRPVFAPLSHMPWNGWSFADTVYPAFLFAVGIAVAFTTAGRLDGTGRLPGGFHLRVLRRTLALFLISLVIANFPDYELRTLRVNDLLSQIGICYAVLAYLNVFVGSRGLVAIFVALLLGQWAVYAFVEIPGHGAGILMPELNAQRYVEQLVFGSFLHHLHTAEVGIAGLMFTTATIATGLSGVLAGRWLKSVNDPSERAAGLLSAGCILAPLGLLWGGVLPINKPLWTGSYAVLTSGISLQVLGLLYWLVGKLGCPWWTRPPHVAGVNALALYVLAWSIQRVVGYGRFTASDGTTIMFRHYLRDHWPAGKLGSLGFSIIYMGVCFALVGYFYRKRWYFKA